MRGVRSASVAGVATLLIALFASPSGAQDESRQRAPNIRVYSQSGPIASRYVTPAIEVSEDAYVFAVALDLDGQIQILHPAFPGISVRVLSHKQLRLPNFFAGFAQTGIRSDGRGSYISYADSYVGSENDTRGSVIALASRVPFNLERVESNGDWNISTIRRLIEHRPPGAAAQALRAYLGAEGEPIGFDYMRFASAHYDNYYVSSPLYSCDSYYGGAGSGVAFRRQAVLNQVEQLRQSGTGVAIVGYDYCGVPIVAYGPSQGYRRHVPRDSSDTLGGSGKPLPRGRSAQSGWSDPREAAIGTFPTTPHAGEVLIPTTPHAGDVFIPTPNFNRRVPGELFNDPRNDRLVRESAERGRAREERHAPPAETPVIGTFPPAREYPRPIVREAPVMVHEPRMMPQPAPSPPPPPPQPAPEVHSKPAAEHVPPPQR
jgi:hypothetical protein